MSDDETLRLFIELTLPPEIVEALGRIQRVCRTRLPEGSIRWVAPEGIHLTLRFLGETAGSRQTDAEAAVKAAVRAAPGPQRLELSGYGSFPSGRTAPRVLFVGMRDVGGGLPALTAALDKALARVGWAPEGRPFRPHLTLGRVREDLRTTQIETLRSALAALPKVEPLAWDAKEVALVRSQMGPGGSRYSRLVAAAL
ncbi:MAG: RNA 2',3'-cyclic phosphodiesterase [Anaerolineales bacterium]|nr:RNA 2',3'-cyclic phosphodiesterase [Anaerolineales bacterium]